MNRLKERITAAALAVESGPNRGGAVPVQPELKERRSVLCFLAWPLPEEGLFTLAAEES